MTISVSQNKPTVGRIVNVFEARSPETPLMGRVVAVAEDHAIVEVDNWRQNDTNIEVIKGRLVVSHHPVHPVLLRTPIYDALDLEQRKQLTDELIGRGEGEEGGGGRG